MNNNNITYLEILINFDSIKTNYKIKTKYIQKPKIGVIDIETYTNTNTKNSKNYTLGLYTSLLDKTNLFYINDFSLDRY